MSVPCQLCPRSCGLSRENAMGACHSTAAMHIANAAPHHGEEPCLCGVNGSGAVFFAGCGLGCLFCQNHAISRDGTRGRLVTEAQLAGLFLCLQGQRVHNINLVSATHHRPAVQKALAQARAQGLHLPVVWNTGGYETLASVRALAEDVNVWLFDLKFHSGSLAKQLANAPDYFPVASAALLQVAAQTGPPVFDKAGLLQQGVIVRILVLPGHRDDAKALLHWLAGALPQGSFLLSLMRQYTPPKALPLPRPLHRPLSSYEYNDAARTALDLGLTRGYFQQPDSMGEQYIPLFSPDV